MQKTLCSEILFSRSARYLVHMFVAVVERVGLFSASFMVTGYYTHWSRNKKPTFSATFFSSSNREPMMFVSLLSTNLIKCSRMHIALYRSLTDMIQNSVSSRLRRADLSSNMSNQTS